GRKRDAPVAVYADAESLGHVAYFPFGADEDGHDHAGGGGIESALQRGLVTRMGHASGDRGNAASCRDQAIVFLVSARRTVCRITAHQSPIWSEFIGEAGISTLRYHFRNMPMLPGIPPG